MRVVQWTALAFVVSLVLAAGTVRARAFQFSKAVSADRIWFSPNPGTMDMLRMFERPEEWAHARQLIDVYNITQQHTFATAPAIVGPNSYDALVRVDAFRKLAQWRKKLSIGSWAVKEFYCTDDASGMNAAVADTLAAVGAIRAAGGQVAYLAMDEPWVSGRSKRCGGPALEPTADRVAFYMSSVNRAHPAVGIGLIEAYPFSSAAAIQSMITLLRARGTTPAFLHMDVDWHALKPGEFVRDMRQLQAFCRTGRIPFGIILTGYNGDADALFAVDVIGIARQMADAFVRWEDMPDHIMLDSWVVSSTGLNITPSNLPEDRPNTQTSLLTGVYRYLRGVTGVPSSQAAVPRQP
jgi:hypothetical protein